MNHEPECTQKKQSTFALSGCHVCPAIRAAYRRGREDAAEALTVFKALENGLTLHGNGNVSPDYFVKLKDASAVARGGEQTISPERTYKQLHNLNK